MRHAYLSFHGEADDHEEKESNDIQYTHKDARYIDTGRSRTEEAIKAEATGSSSREEGLSFRRLIDGQGENDQFPFRSHYED